VPAARDRIPVSDTESSAHRLVRVSKTLMKLGHQILTASVE
jgi:hypothetical protein